MISSIKNTYLTQTHTNKNKSAQSNASGQCKLTGCPVDTISFRGTKPEEGQKTKNTNVFDFVLNIIKGLASFVKAVLDLFFTPASEKMLNKLSKIWVERGNDPTIKVNSFRGCNSPTVVYSKENNELVLNLNKVPSQHSIEEAVIIAEKAVNIDKTLDEKIQKITKKSAEKIGIPEKFIPKVLYSYDENKGLGSYVNGSHFITLNLYWVRDAHQPETAISEIITHELSHARSNLKFSIINPDDIPPQFKQTAEQKAYIDLLQNSPIYNEYRMHIFNTKKPEQEEYLELLVLLCRHLHDQAAGAKSNTTFEKLNNLTVKTYEKIKRETGCNLREISAIDMNILLSKGKVVPNKKEGYAAAQFSPEELKQVIEKIERNKPAIIKELKKLGSAVTMCWNDIEGYTDIYDEALARNTSSQVTQLNIEDGTIEDTDTAKIVSHEHAGELLNNIFRTDPVIRSMVESGELQLDSGLIHYIEDNQEFFRYIDLSNQKDLN